MAGELDPIFQSAADQYGLPVSFLKAIGQQESGLNPGTRDSYAGAQGLMQMLPSTAAAMGASNPRDPAQAIPAAARYLRQGLDATGSLDGAAAYYHGGPDRSQWGPKTANYVASVAGIYNRAAQPAQTGGTMPNQAAAGSIENLSDDQLLKMLTGGAATSAAGGRQGSSGNQGSGTGAQGQPATAGASPEDMSDDDLLKLLTKGSSKPSAPAGTIPADAKPGPGGLMWTADGGYDPETGQLAVAGKPMTDNAAAAAGPMGGVRSGVMGFVEGLPIVGPYAQAGVERGAAAYRALANDQPYSEALRDVRTGAQLDTAAHPYANTAGQVAGGVVGTLPMVAAAPTAFGISEASLAPRVVASMATNTALGAGDAAVRSGGDPGAAVAGGIVGLGTGALGPLLGAGASKALNPLMKVAGGITPAVENVNKLLQAAGMTVDDARAGLARLGPSGVIADLDPAITRDAGGLMAQNESATSTIKRAMQGRAAGADERASTMIDRTLGPKPDLNASLEAIENDASRRAGPLYEAARQGPPMDVTPILADIDRRLPNASGGVESVLNRVRGFLTDRAASANNPVGLDVPKSDPAAIHGARMALDDMISKMSLDSSAGRNAGRVAMDLRDQIDQVMKTNPSFAAADQIFEQSMGLRDAMREGTDVFKRNVRPEDLQRTLAAMTPEQQQAYRAGARVAIGDALEQSRRGELEGAQSMFARGSANRAKLSAIFPNAGDALDALHSEAAMRSTERQLLNQSVTAERTAAARKYARPTASNIPTDAIAAAAGAAMGDPTGGAATAIARRGAVNMLTGAQAAAHDRMVQGTARAMIASGPEQAEFLARIARAQGYNPLLDSIDPSVNMLTQAGLGKVRNKLLGN